MKRPRTASAGSMHLGIKATALFVLVVLLWAFAFWVTARDGLSLLGVKALDDAIGRPTLSVVTAVQTERRVSEQHRTDAWQQPTALTTARQQTDAAIATWRHKALHSSALDDWGSSTLKSLVTDMQHSLDQLHVARAAVDGGHADIATVEAPFDTITDAAFRVHEANADGVDDKTTANDARTLIQVLRAKEMVSREDALISGVLADGRFRPGEHTTLIGLVAAQRYLAFEAVARMRPADRARWQQLVQSRGATDLRTMEDRLVSTGRDGARPPVTAADWQQSTSSVLAGMQTVIDRGGDDVVARAVPGAWLLGLRLVIICVLGTGAVIAAVVISLRTARSMERRLLELRTGADSLIERLHSVVTRMGAGQSVEIDEEITRLKEGPDAIGQLGHGFNEMQETALRVAAREAELRRGTRDTLLHLGRRTQSSLQSLLMHVSELERDHDLTPEQLQMLLDIDHDANLVRRNAENLLVLGGGTEFRRGWTNPISLLDVVRGAVGEVDRYTRVNFTGVAADVHLKPHLVLATMRVLAELIENALRFSPNYSEVAVISRQRPTGYSIEVTDVGGVPISDEQLAELNARIADPPEPNLAENQQIGLIVTGKLAARAGISVVLEPVGSHGGLRAIVFVSSEHLADVPSAAGHPVPSPRLADSAMSVASAPATGTLTLLRPASTDDEALSEDSEQEAAQPLPTTPGGLPFRVPQASLAPELKEPAAPAAAAPAPQDQDQRSPDEIRSIVSSFQRGTQAGRAASGSRERQDAVSSDGDAPETVEDGKQTDRDD